MKVIFNATELRRPEEEFGRIRHLELKIDDTVIMLAQSLKNYPANKMIYHVYVADVFKTFKITIQNGCEIIENPIQKLGDEDLRGFIDFEGNSWFVATAIN